ncbi:MAG: type II toxin-antitoxin system HicA family toxin [Acidobacteriaceae bacterium]
MGQMNSTNLPGLRFRSSALYTVLGFLRFNESQGCDSAGNARWLYQVGQKGSHRQFKHPEKPGKVTIAGHPSEDLATGTFHNILKQAGLK